MGTINIVKTVKQVHPSCVVMVKIGTFYNVYSKDAYIFSHLLNYKIRVKDKIPTCSFPVSSLSKAENVLEKNKINYLVLDKRSNYDECEKVINKQENNYDKIFELAFQSVSILLRIQKIYDELIKLKNNKNINEILEKIEKGIQA